METREYELNSLPMDGITKVEFNSDPQPNDLLLVSSWDKILRLYDADLNALRTKFITESPLLDCCFTQDSTAALSAGLDGSVEFYDVGGEKRLKMGMHEAAVKCIRYAKDHRLAVSGGWDNKTKLWDIRSNQASVGNMQQPGKVFAMSIYDHSLIVGTSCRSIIHYDMRQMDAPIQTKESPLKYQTRSIQHFMNGQGYVVTSIEGRVAIEYLSADSEKGFKNYAFKCHRQKLDGQTLVFPVNAVAFHPKYGTFATGGCDGVVSFWDGYNKKRIGQQYKYPTSVSSLHFNNDGSKLAIASSYTFEEGEKDHPNDTVFIRSIKDEEVHPKTLKS